MKQSKARPPEWSRGAERLRCCDARQRREPPLLYRRAKLSENCLLWNLENKEALNRFTASTEITNGRFFPALKNTRPIKQKSLWLVCPHSQLNRGKVKRFSEYLKTTLRITHRMEWVAGR